MAETSTLYKYSAATQGFILWSCWAFYINSQISFSSGLIAGLVQGLFSFFSTLVVISLLTKLYNHIQHQQLKLFLPPIIIMSCLTATLVLVHTIAKTPRIVETITPSLIVASLFCSFTIYKLASGKTH